MNNTLHTLKSYSLNILFNTLHNDDSTATILSLLHLIRVIIRLKLYNQYPTYLNTVPLHWPTNTLHKIEDTAEIDYPYTILEKFYHFIK